MKKILIVDDQAGWINFHTQAVHEISGNDVEIKTALSAQDGYNALLENISEPFEYLITDMQMEDDYAPKMAGEWLIEQIKSLPQYYKTKIVIISASPKIAHIAKEFGVDYIPKSVALVSADKYKEFLN